MADFDERYPEDRHNPTANKIAQFIARFLSRIFRFFGK